MKCFFSKFSKMEKRRVLGRKQLEQQQQQHNRPQVEQFFLGENIFWPPHAYVEKATYDLKNVSEKIKRKQF
jgi:hypothetical protein